MPHQLRLLHQATLLAIALTGLTACKRTGDDIQPLANKSATVLGEWRLAVSGGGLTGVMTPVSADQDSRLVLGPDSTYAEYSNGKLTRTSTFQLRSQANPLGGADGQLLLLKTYNTPSGLPMYYPYHVTLLTINKLNLSTGGGCAINSEYILTQASNPTPAAH